MEENEIKPENHHIKESLSLKYVQDPRIEERLWQPQVWCLLGGLSVQLSRPLLSG